MIVSEAQYEIAALAARYRRANGPFIALMNRLGGGVEAQMKALQTAEGNEKVAAQLLSMS